MTKSSPRHDPAGDRSQEQRATPPPLPAPWSRIDSSLWEGWSITPRGLVISDPQANGGQVVLVRLTTDDGTWPDRECILTPVDWSELDHNSTVAYSTCKYGPATQALESAIQQGKFDLIVSPSPAVLRQVIAAAHRAAGLPPAAKKLLAQR